MNFTEISAIFFVAAAFAVTAKLVKQPLLIGYILGGVFLGAVGFISDTSLLESLSEVGIALLLFLLGLEMNIKEMPSIGKVSLIVGFGQIITTFIFGFFLSRVLGIGTLASFYIGLATTFSSTIIIIKLLSEKNDLNSLYGRISVGFLLVQDLVAIAVIMFLSSIQKGALLSVGSYLLLGIKTFALFVIVWIMSRRVLPYIFEKFIAGSSELVFVVSIAWALGFAAFMAGAAGFTIEIGGFLAGISLSNLPEHLQISSKTKPVRDFFLTLFFILLGSKLVIESGFIKLIPLAICLSIFVLVGKTLIMLAIMGFLGYKKRTSLLTSINSAQISEFSIIIVSMGYAIGHLTAPQVSLVTLIAVITMTTSTYMILSSEKLYGKVKRLISIFEKSRPKELAMTVTDLKNHVVLVGCDRTGRSIANFLRRKNINFVVVDFNPQVFSNLTSEKTPVVYGDVNDPDTFRSSGIAKSSLVISTMANFVDNLNLLAQINHLAEKPVSIFKAASKAEALELYHKGASYVIVPEFVAGDHIRHLLTHYKSNYSKFVKVGKRHFDKLVYF
jgi:Kef-type K+ transport system membrane component KefB